MTTMSPGSTLPVSYSIGANGVVGFTTFSDFTNTADVACTT